MVRCLIPSLKVVQNSGVRTPAAVALSQAHMPAQATRLALFASIQMALAAPRSLVTIADQMMHEEDIDADEYLWETLPGRCCFQELADDCDTCSVWSDPENFCHMSSDNCEHCGMSLYCDPPPPLLDANKVCKGNSKVGIGCEDDLDTGICKRAGALKDCQAACRKTEHCEIVVLYTDAMTGTCVLCRNLLDYEHTGLALTRIYAVEHLQVDPPSPPGYMVKDSVKHFHIIKDPAPPPPPNPPPSPPLYPPPPLPSFLGTRMETHIECTFEENMDFSITSTTAGSYSDRKAETQKHCCSLCGMEPGCTNFVYEPASKTCVLLPHVPSTELVKTPNPSTVAGSVSISHISNYHADCEFEVGSGYSGGSLGMGAPLSGMKIATKQDCCDACEREAKCVKFSFEIFSGTCEMFVSFSEHYFTSGLASGIVNGRAAQVTHAGVGENAEAIVGLIVPPAPPSFVLQLAASSPPPAGDDIGLRVVADMSLSAGFIMISGFFICLYCFFSPQLLSLLYKVSNGKLGKPSRSLVAGQHSGGVQGKASKKHRRKQQLEPGWAVVTVQTSQLSQNKEVEVEGCETLDELRDVIWEEFGHLLNGIKRPKKDTVILCLTGSDEASGQGWQLVTAASDLARVVDCGALKLMEKILIDVDTLSIAFSRSLPAPKRGTRGAPALLTHRDRNANDDTDDDDTDDDEAPGARRGKGRSGKGEFEPLVADSSSDEGEGTCRAGSDNKANAREKARGQARSARKPKGADAVHDASRGRETQGSKRPTKDAPSSQQGSNLQMDAAPPVLTGDYFDNAPERSNTLPQTRPVAMESDATTAFIGKRVRIHGLASMGELNGQIGLAKSYDQTKQRYRVQFIGPNGTTKVLGFKPVNLQPI